MQTFTISMRHSWLERLLGRNPLVRSSERLEALVVAILALVVVVAVPAACAIGTAIHDTRARFYADHAASRHTVTATAVESSSAIAEQDTAVHVVRAQWNAGGRNHIEKIEWSTKALSGDHSTIWVDGNGEKVGAPTSVSQAGRDAVVLALSLWLAVVGAASGMAYALRMWLNRVRLDGWDRELAAVSADGSPPADSDQ